MRFGFFKFGQTESYYSYAAGLNGCRKIQRSLVQCSGNRPLSIKHYKPDGKLLNRFAHTYDIIGNKLTTNDPFKTISYTYDKLDRLVNVIKSGQINENYTYDPAGNRLSMNKKGVTTNYTYDLANRMLTAGGNSFQYDPNGCLTGKTGTAGSFTYSWNADDTLKQVISPKGTSNYQYNASGQLVRIDSEDQIKRLFHDGNDVILETDDSFTMESAYVLGGGIDNVLSQKINCGKFFRSQHFLHDSLGSVTDQIDDQGLPIGHFRYDVFGKPIPPEGGEHKYRYTSRRHDNNSKLYYYRSRWYMPDVGRFISRDVYPPDPLNTQGLNLYSYVQNNPLKWVDPHGKNNNFYRALAFIVVVFTAHTTTSYFGKGTLDGAKKIYTKNKWCETVGPNELKPRHVTTPTKGKGGVYQYEIDGKIKTGSTNDFYKRYNGKKITKEYHQTKKGRSATEDDYDWTPRRQRRFDEQYIDDQVPIDMKYRSPTNPKRPVSKIKWKKYKHIFGY